MLIMHAKKKDKKKKKKEKCKKVILTFSGVLGEEGTRSGLYSLARCTLRMLFRKISPSSSRQAVVNSMDTNSTKAKHFLGLMYKDMM